MICRQCGTEIADRALICYRCGTATAEPRRKSPSTPSRRQRATHLVLVGAVLLLFAAVVLALTETLEGGSRVLAYVVVAIAAIAAMRLLRR